ncbi:MBOAT family O-acyltransferase [Sulfitobacter sp. SK012]|uniref:MBOAT family O-acyltransferase n=1 Tax=Sulfitobacter sp. SK012 TaxID=1389005 RepID=UPI0013B40CF7|nr:MBOAT family O-acyltransferase [Sulfitobacter sp. SK012]
MMTLDLFTVFLLAFACVPLSWAVPKEYVFDVVAIWTVLCLFALSPATAVWLILIAISLPYVLSSGAKAKGLVAAATITALVLGLIWSRFAPGWAWIGGAFFTLRAIHLVVEWWMGRHPAPKLRESLHYFLFLPVLAAGPINRLPHFQHQLRRRRWDPDKFMTGAERVLLGLVFLYIIASRVGTRLDPEVAQMVAGLGPFWRIWSASAVSWVELFFVFAGATHLALGIALMMGLKLEENFDRPWAARNLIEFWTRWHMSLTRWVQDYVFRPLTALTQQPIFALVAAMLVIGLWHEFSAYYVMWSFWQALGIVVSRLLVQREIGAKVPTRLMTVLGPLGVLAWLSAARPVIGLLLGDIS